VALLVFAWSPAATFDRVDRRAARESPRRNASPRSTQGYASARSRSTSRGMARVVEIARRPATVDREERHRRALKARIRNERAMGRRSPASLLRDGEVLVANDEKGVVYLNLGRRNGLREGAVFLVWRPGKANKCERIAAIRVAHVERTSAEAWITKRFADGVPVVAGMNVSNPLFDPGRQLNVYLARDLVLRDDAYKAIDTAGGAAIPELDDTVNVIVARDVLAFREDAESIGALVVPEADLELYSTW
jgi:hypothetical protein